MYFGFFSHVSKKSLHKIIKKDLENVPSSDFRIRLIDKKFTVCTLFIEFLLWLTSLSSSSTWTFN